jgi:hypothetical protein
VGAIETENGQDKILQSSFSKAAPELNAYGQMHTDQDLLEICQLDRNLAASAAWISR